MLDSEAWRSLSPVARLVYIALKRRTRSNGENNGKAFLSVRDAATECGAHRNTIHRAFWDLQAAGFIKPSTLGHLGVEGVGKATTWFLTEMGYPGGKPTKEYLTWTKGRDFTVIKAAAPSRKQKPVTIGVQPRHQNCDVFGEPVTGEVTPCHSSCDVSAVFEHAPVTPVVPHLESTSRGRA